MGKKILAFDIGTNSAGWALIEEGSHIIDAGVRIFEMGNRMDKDNEISKKGDRTTARSARRRQYRFTLRRKLLTELLKENHMLPDLPVKGEKGTDKTSSYRLYELRYLALNQQIALKDLGKILLYFNKKRGFKSSRKEELADDKESGKVKTAISELKKKIEEEGSRTVGEYFFLLKKDHQNGLRQQERILGNWIGRDMYEHEFDLIWQKQQAYYPDILTNELRETIKKRTIFYQRKLKSQKHLISKCRFEPNKRVAPKSSFNYQEFRLWQKMADLRVTYGNRVNSPLTLEEKEKLAAASLTKGDLTLAETKKILGFPKSKDETLFNDIDKLPGLTTHEKLLGVFGDDFLQFTTEKKHQLWHTLFFFDDTNKLQEYAQNTFGLDPDIAEAYARLKIESDYGSISLKALNKVLPYLKQNFDYTDACEKAGYHHSWNEEEDSKDRILTDFVPHLDPNDIRNPVVQKSTNQCISIANDIIRLHGKPDVIKIELTRELKKPRHVREEERRKNREREQLRKSHAEFLTKTGFFKGEVSWKSSLIDKYQLWLELGCEDETMEQFRAFATQTKKGDLDKYNLWLECNRISPYSGKPITLKRLFDADIEIEHIIPYSKSFDNSFFNKTLCERSLNLEKDNQTPYEYFKTKPDEWERFIKRVEHFDKNKREKLLATEYKEGFLNSQLTNTGYIGKTLRQQMKKAFQTVEVKNGQVTSTLRRLWGLNGILHPKDKPDQTEEQRKAQESIKNREDHRHHAIDAIVIACTTNRYLQILSTASGANRYGNVTNDEIEEPWRYFRGEVESVAERMLVSHENKKRLVTSSINKYRHSHSKNQKGQTAWRQGKAARGPLHEETLYGLIKHPETGDPVYVSKKDVTTIDLKQLDKVVDPEMREHLQYHLENKGKIDHTKNPLLITQKINGEKKKIRVRHVRVENRSTKMVQLRPNENADLYVPTGNNYCLAIYANNGEGKPIKDYISVPFLQAVKSSLKKEPLFPKTKIHDKTKQTLDLEMVLKQGDTLILYDNHPDEINWYDPTELFNKLYYVLKWASTSGQIFLYKHNIREEDADSSPKPILIRANHNSLKGVKVSVNRLGHIKRLAL